LAFYIDFWEIWSDTVIAGVNPFGKACDLIYSIQSITIFFGVREINTCTLNDYYLLIDPGVEDAAVDDATEIEEGHYEEQQSDSERERRAVKR